MAPRWWTQPSRSDQRTRLIPGGRADNRPQLQAALDHVCKLKGTLVVYSLDRLARNVDDARAISKRLQKADANLAILQMRGDTTTPYGKLFFTILAELVKLHRSRPRAASIQPGRWVWRPRGRAAAVILSAYVDGQFLESPAATLAETVDQAVAREVPDTVIGPYKLLDQIGEGGFGIVFLAEQTQPIRRKVALKILKPGMAGHCPLRSRAAGTSADGPSQHRQGTGRGDNLSRQRPSTRATRTPQSTFSRPRPRRLSDS
jgi:hypothetical protein